MCCDGTLFDGVQLERGDSAKHLKAIGLSVVTYRGHKTISRFSQPCAALCQDRVCQVYADRPRQCRTFECKLYKELQAGLIELEPALKVVGKTRRQADKIRRLLRRLGDREEDMAIGERFHHTDSRLERDPSNPDALATFADLSLAMHRLKLLAHERFYSRADYLKASPARRALT